MAQLALYEMEIADMPQVFLPFATDAKGQTLYEKMAEGKFLLGDGRETKKPRPFRGRGKGRGARQEILAQQDF